MTLEELATLTPEQRRAAVEAYKARVTPFRRPPAIAARGGKLYELPAGAIRWWNKLDELYRDVSGDALYRAALALELWAIVAEGEWEHNRLSFDLLCDMRLQFWREAWTETHAAADAALKAIDDAFSPEFLMYAMYVPTSDELVDE